MPAPEFGIYTSLEFLNRANQVNDLLYNVDQSSANWGPQPYLANALGTLSPPLTAFLPDAANPDALVERLNRLLLHGTLSARRAQDHRQRGVQGRRRQSAAPREDGAEPHAGLDRLPGAEMSARHAGRPLQLNSASRRRLLKFAAASGLLAAIDRNVALAQSAPDYKALVCIFLQGGNDGENTLVRYDTAGYQNYAAIRTSASGINLPQAQLLPVQPARGGPAYGFHPACAGWQALFAAKKLAVVANVGMLVQPTTRAGLQNGSAARPAEPVRAQQPGSRPRRRRSPAAWRTPAGAAAWRTGSMPRIRARCSRRWPRWPGCARSCRAGRSVPLSIPRFPSLALSGSGDGHFQFDALRDAAVREMLAQNRSNLYDTVAQVYAEEGVAAASVALPILQNAKSVVAPFFAALTSRIAGQLSTIALMIEGRGQTQLRRQVFFAEQGTYDTHDNQLVNHATLLGDLAKATKAFAGRDGGAGARQRRDDLHAVGVRPHVQARAATRAPTTAGATTCS